MTNLTLWGYGLQSPLNQNKKALESHRLLVVNRLHRLQHVRHGFNNLKIVISMWKTMCALVDHKVRRRGIAGSTGWWPNSNSTEIGWCLRVMGKINKIGKWVPHNLNDWQMENRKSFVEYCFSTKKESHFYTKLWLVTKNGFQHQGQITLAKNHALCLVGPEQYCLLWTLKAQLNR